MKIYSDSSCSDQVFTLDLGTVDVGSSKHYEYYVKNDSNAQLIDLKFSISHDEICMLQSPTVLEANEVGKVCFTYTPSMTLKEGLKTRLQIEGRQVWS